MKNTLKKILGILLILEVKTFIFPKEQTVRFINKYIARYNSKDKLKYVENIKNKKSLDFGCGIRQLHL